MDRTAGRGAAFALVGLLLAVPIPVAAHVGTDTPHDHSLQLATFGIGLAVLAASLGADHLGVLERSTADAGIVIGAVGMFLGLALLWV